MSAGAAPGPLPNTGSGAILAAAGRLALLGVGATLLALGRRRRLRFTSAR